MLRAVFALILFAGMMWIVDLETSTPPFCISNDAAQTDANQYNENCAPLSRAVIGYGRDGFTFIGHFIHDFKDEIIAAFTVILAISTLYLWLATRKLVKGTENTAQRQLRAYVWTEAKPFPNLDYPNFTVTALIKNNGQTPAYDVQTWAMISPIAEPLPRGFVFPGAPRHLPSARYVIAPTSEHFMKVGPEEPFSAEERLAIRQGLAMLYFWGEVRYRDTFGENRKTRFRLCWGTTAPENSGAWIYCDEGNDADQN